MSPQRTLWSDLRAIDQAIIPRLARWLTRTFTQRRRDVADLRTVVARGSGGPTATLARLDRRYASAGLLGLVRDVPQLGAVLLAALIVCAAVVVAIRVNRPAPAATEDGDVPTVTAAHAAQIGPFPGEDVASYLSAAETSLTQLAAVSPTAVTYALADFEKGRTPAETAAALAGVQPVQVYVRVHVKGATEYFPATAGEFDDVTLRRTLTVSTLPDDANTIFTALAGALEKQAAANEQFARSIPASDPSQQDQEQKASQLKDAGHYRAEAAALRSACACIYAVVVQSQTRTLLHLLQSGQVRTVDAALPGLKLGDISWIPLRPETTVRQPVPSAGGP